jgi:hypothetical protein
MAMAWRERIALCPYPAFSAEAPADGGDGWFNAFP